MEQEARTDNPASYRLGLGDVLGRQPGSRAWDFAQQVPSMNRQPCP